MKAARSIALLLFVALSLPACSRFSAEGRRQRAYAKYVRKSSATLHKQRTKSRAKQQEIPSAPDTTETTTTTEAMPSDG